MATENQPSAPQSGAPGGRNPNDEKKSFFAQVTDSPVWKSVFRHGYADTPRNRILQVSDGFTYTWDAAAPTGSKVDAATIKLDGVTLVPGTGYRVTVNSFMADGGDNFSTLVDGTSRLGGEVDLDALVTYFGANSPVPPGPQDRITRVN